GVEIAVAAPRTTRDLVMRLVRVRRGNAEMRAASGAVRASNRWSWLRDVVLADLRLAPDAVAYVAITLLAGYRARRSRSGAWERDQSTRTGPQARRDDSA